MRKSMTIEQLQDVLDHQGSDLSAWPASLQSAARDLLSTSDEASELLAYTQKIAATLKTSANTHRAPTHLAQKILHDGRLHTSPAEPSDAVSDILLWMKAAIWRPALLAIVPLLIGFTLGVAIPPTDIDADLSALSLISAYEEIDYDAQ
jgi:hypothetical protein